jgi:hypothetical protein
MGTPGLFESTFGFTGAQQDWTVPAGVTLVNIEIAGGGAVALTANVAVTPGEVLHLFIGGGPSHALGAGGWNGGADGPVAPLMTGGFPPQFVSAASSGATDVRRGGTDLAHRVMVAGGRGGLGWTVFGGVLGQESADSGEIDTSLGYLVLGPQPGPSDPPRAPRVIPPPGYEYLTPGGSGDVADGAAGYLFVDSEHAAGAGGGGFGGGASGSVFGLIDPGDTDPYFARGGNTGGWFAATGIGATATGSNAHADGYALLTWMTAQGTGWNVGHLGG